MSREYNYAEYSYGSIIGGHHNTVNNYFHIDPAVETFFEGGTERTEGNEYLHFLLLLNDSCDDCRNAVIKRLDEAFAVGRYPLWVDITDLVDTCARIVYFNGGPSDDDVRKLINRFFSVICIPLDFKYKAKIVGVGRSYFFEMYPQE